MAALRRAIGHRRGPLAGSLLIRIMDMSDMHLDRDMGTVYTLLRLGSA